MDILTTNLVFLHYLDDMAGIFLFDDIIQFKRAATPLNRGRRGKRCPERSGFGSQDANSSQSVDVSSFPTFVEPVEAVLALVTILAEFSP